MHKKIRIILKKVIIYLIVLTSLLKAHPHTFIDVYPTLHVEGSSIIKTHIKWKIDDMTSAMLIMEVDSDGDGKINKQENDFVYENYFMSLSKSNFYMGIVVNDKVMTLPNPKNFQATIEDNRICYSFDIDKKYNIKETKFEFYDEEFMVAMMLKKEFVKAKDRKVKITGEDKDFYYMYRLEVK